MIRDDFHIAGTMPSGPDEVLLLRDWMTLQISDASQVMSLSGWWDNCWRMLVRMRLLVVESEKHEALKFYLAELPSP